MLLFALLCGREYSNYANRKIEECEGYLSLLLHIEKMIDSYLAPPSVIFAEFECEALEKNGFLPLVREGKSPCEALGEIKSALPNDMHSELVGYFAGFGKGYRDSELSRTCKTCGELERMVENERAGLEKSVKVTRALLFGAAAGITILII